MPTGLQWRATQSIPTNAWRWTLNSRYTARYWGYDTFLPDEAVVRSIAAGATLGVVMPTGGGIIACYYQLRLCWTLVALWKNMSFLFLWLGGGGGGGVDCADAGSSCALIRCGFRPFVNSSLGDSERSQY